MEQHLEVGLVCFVLVGLTVCLVFLGPAKRTPRVIVPLAVAFVAAIFVLILKLWA